MLPANLALAPICTTTNWEAVGAVTSTWHGNLMSTVGSSGSALLFAPMGQVERGTLALPDLL